MDARELVKTKYLCTVFAIITMTSSSSMATDIGHQRTFGLGQPVTEQQLRAWDIDIAATGVGLPAGSGNVGQGKLTFQAKCASCHGLEGQGGLANKLIGGGNLNTAGAVKTIGSYWPYATTIFDYIRRAMPYGAPQSLSNDEVYGLTAFLLNANQIVGIDAIIDASSLPLVQMPNRSGFIRVER